MSPRSELPYEVHVVPAEPGWYTVLIIDDDADPLCIESQVLAWAVLFIPKKDQAEWEAPIADTWPITINGIEFESQLWGYQDPRGKILQAEGDSYSCLAEAKTEVLRRQAEAKARKTAERESVAKEGE